MASDESGCFGCGRIRIARRGEHRRPGDVRLSGRANSHRHYVAYWLMLERANQMIFQTWAGLSLDPLVQAGGNLLDVRVPLRTMGIVDAAHPNITIGDAQWPKSAVFSIAAQQYQ